VAGKHAAEVSTENCSLAMLEGSLGAQRKSLSDPWGEAAGQWEVFLPSSREQDMSKCHSMARLLGGANHEGPSPPTPTQSDKIHI